MYDVYLTCNGCGQQFHAMNYVSAFEHGAQAPSTGDWCGAQGFTMTGDQGSAL